MAETLLTNARLVLPDAVRHGTLSLRDGTIAELGDDTARHPGALDCEGDYILPGFVDLHTDNLERQVQPRANARWPSRSAFLAHDAQCAAAGVTTVLDALCLGDLGFDRERIQTFRDGVADLDALSGTGLLKAAHYLHLRCELPASDLPETLESVAAHPLVRMASLMDHTPGLRQYADMERYRALRRRDGLTEAAIERRIVELLAQRERLRAPNRRMVIAAFAGRPVPLASHDDETEADIAENVADGVGISEFPVTMTAARAARAAGMTVIAGAPNVVRGGSHSGNVAVADLLAAGAVDAFASDYVPGAMVEAAFRGADTAGIGLPAAIALITDRPARMAGFTDRGRIAPGLRADLVRVRVHDGIPVIRAVWRGGERVA
jgi:alpha-D-ribose 1-methylphosphonate 5-triphosphate diphosphatase